jgi:hypothetical protein
MYLTRRAHRGPKRIVVLISLCRHLFQVWEEWSLPVHSDRFRRSIIDTTETPSGLPRRHHTLRSWKVDGPSTLVVRAGVSGLLVVIAAVHLHLWFSGYRYIPTIGPLFMVDVITATVLAAVVVFRVNTVIAVAAASFAAGTLGANVLSLTLPDGLFQFREVGVSYSGAFAIASEAGIVVCLAVWMGTIHRRVPQKGRPDRAAHPSAEKDGDRWARTAAGAR